MPKIDFPSVPEQTGSGYPAPYDVPCASRTRRRLGHEGKLKDFGINFMTLPPGGWSSQRHWHSHEDEFVFVLDGELKLIEDDTEVIVGAGECAAFPKGTGVGHHFVNESSTTAVYIEIGSCHPEDITTCSDVDMMSANSDGRFVRKDGTPISERGNNSPA